MATAIDVGRRLDGQLLTGCRVEALRVSTDLNTGRLKLKCRCRRSFIPPLMTMSKWCTALNCSSAVVDDVNVNQHALEPTISNERDADCEVANLGNKNVHDSFTGTAFCSG
jgi:hypothetical protein